MKSKLSILLISTVLCILNTSIYSMQNRINNQYNNIQDINKKNSFINKLDRAKQIIISQQLQKLPTSGLQNVGATCYMNATLQIFTQLPAFNKSLFKYVVENYDDLVKTQDGLLTIEFANVMAEAITQPFKNPNDISQFTANTDYAPRNFKNIIGTIDNTFVGIQANDSKDLLDTILQTIHRACTSNLSNNKIKNNNQKMKIDQTNYNEVFLNTFNQFKNEDDSVISRYFWGLKNAVTTYSPCNHKAYNMYFYNMLNFPLENVRQWKYKDNQNSLSSYETSPITIDDCFNYNKNIIYSFLKEDEKSWCVNCKTMRNHKQQTELIYTPNILNLILDRGKDNTYKKIKVIIPEVTDFNQFTPYNKPSGKYYLSSVVCHSGSSGMGGHFILIGRKSPNSPWYKYNDQNVSQMTNQAIQQILNGKNETYTTYIATYCKIKQ